MINPPVKQCRKFDFTDTYKLAGEHKVIDDLGQMSIPFGGVRIFTHGVACRFRSPCLSRYAAHMTALEFQDMSVIQVAPRTLGILTRRRQRCPTRLRPFTEASALSNHRFNHHLMNWATAIGDCNARICTTRSICGHGQPCCNFAPIVAIHINGSARFGIAARRRQLIQNIIHRPTVSALSQLRWSV